MTGLLLALLLNVDVGDDPELMKWIAERQKQAKAGTIELVRFPLVHHDTWGSDYPTYFIGVSPESGPGACPCLAVKFDKGSEEPSTLDPKTGRDNGRLALVEGMFTGETSKTGLYTLNGFTVLRHRPYLPADGSEAKVVATGAQLAEVKEPLEGDKPWLVTVDSFDLFDAAQAKKADALLEKVKKAGFADTELLDSRRAKLLFCCYRVVVAGHFATQDEANVLLKALKKKGFANAGVRKAFEPVTAQ